MRARTRGGRGPGHRPDAGSRTAAGSACRPEKRKDRSWSSACRIAAEPGGPPAWPVSMGLCLDGPDGHPRLPTGSPMGRGVQRRRETERRGVGPSPPGALRALRRILVRRRGSGGRGRSGSTIATRTARASMHGRSARSRPADPLPGGQPRRRSFEPADRRRDRPRPGEPATLRPRRTSVPAAASPRSARQARATTDGTRSAPLQTGAQPCAARSRRSRRASRSSTSARVSAARRGAGGRTKGSGSAPRRCRTNLRTTSPIPGCCS